MQIFLPMLTLWLSAKLTAAEVVVIGNYVVVGNTVQFKPRQSTQNRAA
ncbi:MAG: hypothetical protein U1F16_02110 [Turneriella sp.]